MMIVSFEFLKAVIDTVPDQIAVIDGNGGIRFVNSSWVEFARANGGERGVRWTGVNYLDVCRSAAALGDEDGRRAVSGIRKVIERRRPSFYLEYPCHGPDEARWFLMWVTWFELDGNRYFVISHQNITRRKLAEEEALRLSRVDGLTGVYNRRYFDEFLAQELKRCARLALPITLALVDVDYFKRFNDHYGHQAGDDCLRKVAAVLEGCVRRPSDRCARYGGEEFALVLGNTDLRDCQDFMEHVLVSIRELGIPHEESPVLPVVTASIGAATLYPDSRSQESSLVQSADALLYRAKRDGRNRVVCGEAGPQKAARRATERNQPQD